MIIADRRRVRVIGFLGSLALHVAASALVFWPGGTMLSVAATEVTRPSTSATAAPPAFPIASTAAVADLTQAVDGVALPGHAATALLGHLWQSTLFAGAIALIALAFKKHQARIRYTLWFGASIKFFIPFSLLLTLGRSIPLPSASLLEQAAPAVTSTFEQMARPFFATSSRLAAVVDAPGPSTWVTLLALGVWAAGFLAIGVRHYVMWRRVQRMLRASVVVGVVHSAARSAVHVRAVDAPTEPGVVGLWRPIILLPAGLKNHLTPPQFEAVLAHELCHIRRRDNLTAAVHMLVEAAYWFHPVVWWIGGRLVHERERACDEHVVQGGADARTYAESIVRVCRNYVDAHLACVAGVSGSHLKARIEAIMRNEGEKRLGPWRTLTLAAGLALTLIAPVTVGALSAPRVAVVTPPSTVAGPAFVDVSIKVNRSGDTGMRFSPEPGDRFTATNVSSVYLIRFAYDLPDFQVTGGPGWLASERYDITARADFSAPVAQQRLMLRRVLEERFLLRAHDEQQIQPTFALRMARADGSLGPRLRRTGADCSRAAQPTRDAAFGPFSFPASAPPECGFFGFAPDTNFPLGRAGFAFRGISLEALARIIEGMVRRNVADQTRLSGYFDADFDFIAEIPPPPPPPGRPNPFARLPSVFTVFQEQLGLKLEARSGPVEVLVIDRAERPKEN